MRQSPNTNSLPSHVGTGLNTMDITPSRNPTTLRQRSLKSIKVYINGIHDVTIFLIWFTLHFKISALPFTTVFVFLVDLVIMRFRVANLLSLYKIRRVLLVLLRPSHLGTRLLENAV